MKLRQCFKFLIALSAVYFIPFIILSDEIDKANKYFEKYDYKYALEIYEKLMKEKPSVEVAQKLASCYRYINNTDAAELAYAKVLTFPDAGVDNYRFYADVLKQNGKFDEAKKQYLLYAEKSPEHGAEAAKLANSCDAARILVQNPDARVKVENEVAFNSENADFSPIQFGKSLMFVSDRWFVNAKNPKKDKDDKVVSGWTGNPYLKLYEIKEDKQKVQIDMFDRTINSQYHNGPAVATASGDTLYFTRTDVGNSRSKVAANVKLGKKYICQAIRSNGVWGKVKVMPFGGNGSYSVQHPALSPDGKVLYFASDMPGGSGGMDLYFVERLADGNWSAPKNCGPNINSSEDDVFPYVRKDGKFYFSSRGHVGIGGLDLFEATGSKDNFSMPENLKSPMNSSKDDFGIMFKEDNKSGYISSNRPGGAGMDDIYKFSIADEIKDTKDNKYANGAKTTELVLTVQGKVVEKGAGTALAGVNVILVNKTTGKETQAVSDANGEFGFKLEPEMDYVLRGDLDKFFTSQQGNVSTKGQKQSAIYEVKFELERSKDLFVVRLNNIYYDFNKWNIRKDAQPELNKVTKFLNSAPGVNIELSSHTDSRGPAVYNLFLSQKRAESATKYLEGAGVAAGRIKAVGKGETELLNRCADGIKCSAKEHQLNRRTEFKVIKVSPVASTNDKSFAKR